MGGLGRLLFRQRLDSLDHQDDCQNDQQYSQNGLSIRSPVSAALCDHTDLVLNGQAQRADGHHHHECHGDEEHLVILADVTQPGCHSQKSQACQQLVCRSE